MKIKSLLVDCNDAMCNIGHLRKILGRVIVLHSVIVVEKGRYSNILHVYKHYVIPVIFAVKEVILHKRVPIDSI